MRNIFLALGLLISTTSYSQENAVTKGNQTTFTKHTSKESALKAAGLEEYATSDNDKIIAESTKNLESIKQELGNEFGGAWIEYDDNKRATLVIGVSGEETIFRQNSQNQNKNQRIVFKKVNYNLAYLNSIETKIADIFRGIEQGGEAILLSSGVYEKENKVFVRGRKENYQYITEIIQRSGIDTSIIVFEEQNGPITLMGTIYSGTKIGATYDGTQSMYLCTTGFHVVIDDIYPGSITAAHCLDYDRSRKFVHFNTGNSPGSIKGPLIGEFFADGWEHKMDAILFGNTNFVHTLQRQIITTGNNLANVKPLIVPTPFTTICTSGGSNGWRCGTLVTPSTRHTIKGREFFLGEFSACGGPGDSGGPVVSNAFNAIGIYVGSPGEHPDGTCGAVFGGGPAAKSVYQPLGPYLTKYYNIKLLTN